MTDWFQNEGNSDPLRGQFLASCCIFMHFINNTNIFRNVANWLRYDEKGTN